MAHLELFLSTFEIEIEIIAILIIMCVGALENGKVFYFAAYECLTAHVEPDCRIISAS